jgi:sarcosine oxidase subunit alpha
MDRIVHIRIDGTRVTVPLGTTVAAALANHGRLALRRSVRGEARGPLCGMGSCFECRATVDGRRQVRTCMVRCTDGMEVHTDG